MKTDLSPCVGIRVAQCLRHWLAKPCPELSVLMVLSSVRLLLGLRDLVSVSWAWVILCRASHHTLFSFISYKLSSWRSRSSNKSFHNISIFQNTTKIHVGEVWLKKKKYTLATARTYWAHLLLNFLWMNVSLPLIFLPQGTQMHHLFAFLQCCFEPESFPSGKSWVRFCGCCINEICSNIY